LVFEGTPPPPPPLQNTSGCPRDGSARSHEANDDVHALDIGRNQIYGSCAMHQIN